MLSETVESVRCRWCNADDTVELVPRPEAPAVEGALPDALPGP